MLFLVFALRHQEKCSSCRQRFATRGFCADRARESFFELAVGKVFDVSRPWISSTQSSNLVAELEDQQAWMHEVEAWNRCGRIDFPLEIT
jgi:hypothetical protein